LYEQCYLIINMKRLLCGLDIASVKRFKNWYSETLAEN
jgi:hypothetical protein